MNKARKTCTQSLFLVFSIAISACDTEKEPKNIGDIDVMGGGDKPGKVFIKPKSDQEIREAYINYLKSAEVDESTRLSALSRLAELEIKASQKEGDKQDTTNKDESINPEDKAYEDKLDRTIALLETSLRDYPEAKNNDTLLYQLAKAYDQKGMHQLSIEQLQRLTENYPNSSFYAEAQFRIAEEAFSYRDYRKAEYAYTEVIVSPENSIFYEKSLFKRGWSRFKQRFYLDAADDFIDAITRHGFDEYEKLKGAELEQFNEYFRAIALTFSYMGGPQDIQEYFSNRPNFRYTYYIYSVMGDIYLKQERFSDTVHIHQQFIKHYPKSDNIPYSRLKIIDAWQKSGFDKKVYEAIDEFYSAYNPSSKYWVNQNENSNINRVIRRSLKKYVILISEYYHNKYQASRATSDFEKAAIWYRRYLEYYGAYALNDNIYFLYAELLSQMGKHKSALQHYEKAAYQNDIIVNKDAAYASITTSDKLYSMHPEDKEYLKKHITYALKYAQTYPNDKYTGKLIIHAIEIAFKSKEYKTTIELADIYLTNRSKEQELHISSIKAESYFNLGEYAESESIYADIIPHESNKASRAKLNDKLALSIYEQANFSNKNNDISGAIHNYSRISDVAPDSDIAPTGLYDAIALAMQHKQWKPAIDLIKRFQDRYPEHKMQMDVSKKLSAAYLYSNQGIKAAQEFEKLSSIGDDSEVKAAALWQAAEIYIDKGKPKEAIKAYESYVRNFKKPYPQYLEAMNKLTELNKSSGFNSEVAKWQKTILSADSRALNNAKTERTKYIVSTSALELANSQKDDFDSAQLTLPLKTSLKKKKLSMQNAVKLYAKASKYKVFEIVTESTYKIASIYKEFSKSLMNSERPKNLNEEELNQYEILLEDQAFPFEDKAIEFYEINLSRIKDGYYNDWIKQSHGNLITLFPTRYKREPKQDAYVININ